MNVIYRSSSGIEINLNAGKPVRIKEANYHNYAFQYDGSSRQYGVKIGKFKKTPCEYKTKLFFYGSVEERASNIEKLQDECAYDIQNMRPGKLIWNNWYIECYVLESSTYPHDDIQGITVMDIVFLCPYPFWIQEEKKQMIPWEDAEDDNGMDYPYDYPFDFSVIEKNSTKWVVNHNAPSDFKMIVYGPCENPKVIVNGYPYQVFTMLDASDYMIIDSKNHEITKYLANGTKENLFNSRQFEPSVFEKIPSGELSIIRAGNFGVDITVMKERSEPKWS